MIESDRWVRSSWGALRMINWLRQQLHELVTRDFFPEISAKVRNWLYHPLGILTLAALASLLCGFFLHAQGFVLFGGVVAVIALGLLWPWLSLRGLTGELAFDRPRCSEGEAIEVRLTLRNRLPWSAWGLAVRDGFGVAATEAVAGIAAAPKRRSAVCRWLFTPPKRGIYPLSPPQLTTGFPFGLWETRRPLRVFAPLIVWPKTFPVGPVPPMAGDSQIEGNVSRSKVGSHGDVIGVRPYRRGDSPRRIHWGQSAKHDRLIVCELQSNARPVIQLVLDTDAQVHLSSEAGNSLEWAIRIVASFARGWLNHGAQIALAWADGHLSPASGTAQLHRLLDTLAGLPHSASRPLEQTLASPACAQFNEGLQIIVTTDRVSAAVRRGLRDPETQHWVILRSAAFGAEVPSCGISWPVWLDIDSIERIPALLKGGWREAQHGS